MDDLISRKDAIDALNIAMNIWSSMPEWREHKIIECLEELPSAQPEKRTEERTETHACDCISRKAAIEAVGSMLRRKFGIGGDLAEITLAGLPSAQPEVIRCKDCKWYGRADKRRFYRGMDCLQKRIDTIIPDKDFCSRAERREE